jgi:hypothetical protein
MAGSQDQRIHGIGGVLWYLSGNALALVPEDGQRPRDGGLEQILGQILRETLDLP